MAAVAVGNYVPSYGRLTLEEASRIYSGPYVTDVTTTSTADAVWRSWVDGAASTTAVPSVAGTQQVIYRRTPEEIEAIEKEREKREQDRQQAIERARDFLKALLSPEQWRMYMTKRYFLVKGEIHPWYRVRKDLTHNIDVLDQDGVIVRTLCVQPAHVGYPDEDRLAIQLLGLQHEEEQMNNVANKSDRRKGEVVPLPVAV